MKLVNRTVSALAFSATLLASTSAFALTPFQVASQAYRGQIDGISGYQTLHSQVRSGRVTGEEILKAAGLEANASDADLVESFLNPGNDN